MLQKCRIPPRSAANRSLAVAGTMIAGNLNEEGWREPAMPQRSPFKIIAKHRLRRHQLPQGGIHKCLKLWNQIAQQQRSAGITREAREATQSSSLRSHHAPPENCGEIIVRGILESRAFWLARMRNMPDYLNS